jgi:hypothetical protein
MKFSGKITKVMPVQTGKSEKGSEWKRQTFVVMDDNPNVAYPDEVALDIWNDHIPEQPLEVGQHVEVFCSIRAKAYEGRMYNEFNVFVVRN